MGLLERFNLPRDLASDIFKPHTNARSRHVHSNILKEIHARRMLIYIWSFFLHSIRQWNNLPKNSPKLLEIQFKDDVFISHNCMNGSIHMIVG